MKKRWLLLGGIPLALVIILLVVLLGSQPEPVPAVQLKRENVIATLTVTGEVRANITVDFSPPASERIRRILVDEGSWIQPGQLLVELDTDQLQAQIRQAQAQAAQAQAAYVNVLQGSRPEEIQAQQARLQEATRRIQQSQAALSQAHSRLADAQRNAQRFQQLFKQEFVSEQEYQSAQLQQDVAEREVIRAQADLSAVRATQSQVQAQLQQALNGPTTAEIHEAAQAAQAARANVQATQARMEDYHIVSNIRGIVIQRVQDAGDLASPGQPVLRAVEPKTLQIICSVDENDLAKVHVGDQAYAVLDALPDVALNARIIKIGSQVTPENGAVEVRAVLTEDAWRKLSQVSGSEGNPVTLMLGMTADVNVVTDRLRQALVLPAITVKTDNGKPVVYKFQGHRLVKTPIAARRISVENYLVLSGLQPGDWVAATADAGLAKKKRVKPLPESQVPKASKPPSGMSAP